MKLGFIGLGRMGMGMIRRLLEAGHEVVGYDLSKDNLRAAQEAGAASVPDLEGLVGALSAPRVLWLMIPVGRPVDSTIEALLPLVDEGDVIIDGGNSNYQDTVRRAAMLEEQGVHFVDVGTSGGVWGLEHGFALMVGGSPESVALLEPALEALAPGKDLGWGHVGPPGAGHFVKMVHNGIEYGLMQAYAEGFEIMSRKHDFDLDLGQIAEIWRHGSVVRSWLLDLLAAALDEGFDLDRIGDHVGDSGTGRWTVHESVDLGVPAPVISLALQMRLRSQQERSFAGQLLAAMRYKFGGHEYRPSEDVAPTDEL
jgi:6-phosphogluconate dehydrogenase